MSTYKPMAPLDRIDRMIRLYEGRLKQSRATLRETGSELWAQAVRCECVTLRELKELRRDVGRDVGLTALPKRKG
jgi:hypothetical protein